MIKNNRIALAVILLSASNYAALLTIKNMLEFDAYVTVEQESFLIKSHESHTFNSWTSPINTITWAYGIPLKKRGDDVIAITSQVWSYATNLFFASLMNTLIIRDNGNVVMNGTKAKASLVKDQILNTDF